MTIDPQKPKLSKQKHADDDVEEKDVRPLDDTDVEILKSYVRHSGNKQKCVRITTDQL